MHKLGFTDCSWRGNLTPTYLLQSFQEKSIYYFTCYCLRPYPIWFPSKKYFLEKVIYKNFEPFCFLIDCMLLRRDCIETSLNFITVLLTIPPNKLPLSWNSNCGRACQHWWFRNSYSICRCPHGYSTYCRGKLWYFQTHMWLFSMFLSLFLFSNVVL